eukprot:COSAG04_NODE_725_length_10792_cov_4.701206_11_plen_177_part_00
MLLMNHWGFCAHSRRLLQEVAGLSQHLASHPPSSLRHTDRLAHKMMSRWMAVDSRPPVARKRGRAKARSVVSTMALSGSDQLPGVARGQALWYRRQDLAGLAFGWGSVQYLKDGGWAEPGRPWLTGAESGAWSCARLSRINGGAGLRFLRRPSIDSFDSTKGRRCGAGGRTSTRRS